MILGGDEMNRTFAVVGILQVRAIATFTVEPVAAIGPRLTFIFRDHVIGLVMESAVEIEDATVRQEKRIGVCIVVAGIVGVGIGRFTALRRAPNNPMLRLGLA